MDFKTIAVNIFSYLVDKGYEYQSKTEALADEIIAKEPPRYTSVGNKKYDERVQKQQEAVSKAKAYKEKLEKQRENQFCDDDEDDDEDEYEYEEFFDGECCNDAINNVDEICYTNPHIKYPKTNSYEVPATNKYSSLLLMFNKNPLNDKITTKPYECMANITNHLFMYLTNVSDCFCDYFFDYLMTLKIKNKLLNKACFDDFRISNELICLGFAERGVKNFDGGFAFTNNYLLYKKVGCRTLNVHLSKIYSITSVGEKILINEDIEIDSSHSPFSSEFIVDIINFLVVKYLKREKLI